MLTGDQALFRPDLRLNMHLSGIEDICTGDNQIEKWPKI